MTKRWSETQHTAAAYLRGRGWPFAEAVGNGRQGADVTGTPGLSIEVKALKDDRRPAAMLKQAAKRAGLPLVVYRPPGYGPANVAEWPCILRFEDVAALLAAAGYGDGLGAHAPGATLSNLAELREKLTGNPYQGRPGTYPGSSSELRDREGS